MKKIVSIVCALQIVFSSYVLATTISTDNLTGNEKTSINDELLIEDSTEKIDEKDEPQGEIIKDENTEDKNLDINESIDKLEKKDIIKKKDQEIQKKSNEEPKAEAISTEQEKQTTSEKIEIESSYIQEGVYTIRTALKDNLVLDVSEASKNDTANIQLWKDSTVKQQRFLIKKVDSELYSIFAEHSGKAIDVQNAGKTNYTNVQQYSSNNTDAQKWYIKKTENGHYNIVSKCNGLFLDVTNAATKYGTNIQVYEGNGTRAQEFILERMDLDKQADIDLKNGKYIIESAVDSNKVLDISEGSIQNGANLQIWQSAYVTQQRFEIALENGFYSIKCEKSGKSLDVVNSGITNYTNVQQYNYSGNKAQQWIIKPTDDGYYNIISKYSGLYLDVNGASNKNGTNVQLYQGNGTKAQKFKLKRIGLDDTDEVDIENGRYIIRSSLNKNKVLDVSAASKDNGANIQIWNSCHDLQQQFDIKYEKGFYSIKNVNSGKSLNIEGKSITNGSNVNQNTYTQEETQKWIIIKNEDNTYSFVSKYNGLYIDICNASTNNGTNVQLYEGNGTNAQKFILDKVEDYKGEKTIEDGTYKIRCSSNDYYVLDISEGSTKNCANTQIWNSVDVLQQMFNIRYIEDGYYSIIPVHSGKALDVQNAGRTNGTNVQQYEINNTDAQKWIIKENDGEFFIISKKNNLFLTVADNVTNNGKNIYTWEKDEDKLQSFILDKLETKSEKAIESDTYEIATSTNTNMVVDVNGASKEENANVQIWERNGTAAQKYRVEYIDGLYEIRNPNSNMLLTVDENGNVVQKSEDDSEQQKWIIKRATNGHYNIVSVYNGKYLETENKLYSGANIQVGNKDANKKQEFKFLTRKYTVVLNPGHGGKEPGCIGWSGLMEKNITLRIAQYVRDELNKSLNYNVILTHEGLDDWYEMSLSDRAQIARDNNADVYVSLHINAEPNNTASGSMVFVPYYEGDKHYNSTMSKLGNIIQNWLEKIGIKKYTTEAITKRCNDHDPRYQYRENGAIVQADYYADIRHAMKGSTLGYGADLNTDTGIPAILVEHCFINTDTVFVQNDDALRRVGVADANAIREYFETK